MHCIISGIKSVLFADILCCKHPVRTALHLKLKAHFLPWDLSKRQLYTKKT